MPLSVLQKSHMTLGYEPQTKPPVQTWPISFHSLSRRKCEPNIGSSGSWGVSPFPFSNSPIFSKARVGEEPSVLHNTCTGCGSQSLWARRASREQLSKEEGKTCLRRFLIKMCWFQMTSGCFWIAGKGSFSPTPKLVTQQLQPGWQQAANLYFSDFHAAGLLQENRQTSAGKHNCGKVFHLIYTYLLFYALLWVTCAHRYFLSPVFMSDFSDTFLLLFFLSSISFSPSLDLLNLWRSKRIIC